MVIFAERPTPGSSHEVGHPDAEAFSPWRPITAATTVAAPLGDVAVDISQGARLGEPLAFFLKPVGARLVRPKCKRPWPVIPDEFAPL